MSRLFVFVVSLFLVTVQAFAAGALTQQKCGTAVTDPATLTFDASTSSDSGTVIVACIGFDDGDNVSSTDDGSSLLTWTEHFEQEQSSFESAVCASAEGTSSIDSVTITSDGNNLTDNVMCIFEFSGLDYSSLSHNSTTVTNSTSHSSGNVTAETDGVMVGVFYGNTADFGTASSPWTDGETFVSSCTGGATTDCEGAVQYRLVSSGGSLDYSVTAGAASRDSAIGVLEIGPSAAGGGGSNVIPIWLQGIETIQMAMPPWN